MQYQIANKIKNSAPLRLRVSALKSSVSGLKFVKGVFQWHHDKRPLFHARVRDCQPWRTDLQVIEEQYIQINSPAFAAAVPRRASHLAFYALGQIQQLFGCAFPESHDCGIVEVRRARHTIHWLTDYSEAPHNASQPACLQQSDCLVEGGRHITDVSAQCYCHLMRHSLTPLLVRLWPRWHSRRSCSRWYGGAIPD